MIDPFPVPDAAEFSYSTYDTEAEIYAIYIVGKDSNVSEYELSPGFKPALKMKDDIWSSDYESLIALEYPGEDSEENHETIGLYRMDLEKFIPWTKGEFLCAQWLDGARVRVVLANQPWHVSEAVFHLYELDSISGSIHTQKEIEFQDGWLPRGEFFGRYILLYRFLDEEKKEFALYNLNSAEIEPLPVNGDLENAQWNDMNNYFIYSAETSRGTELTAYRPDRSVIDQQLLSGKISMGGFSLSPSGELLAFETKSAFMQDGMFPRTVMVWAPEESRLERIWSSAIIPGILDTIMTGPELATTLAWAPDSDSLTFEEIHIDAKQVRADGGNRIFTLHSMLIRHDLKFGE